MSDTPSRTTLPAIGILQSLSEEARSALAEAGDFSGLPEGLFLMRQGEPQDHLYVLIQGKLSASVRSESSLVELGMIMPGESVGEMNVIDPKTASADVKAVISCRVWSISKTGLDEFIERFPAHAAKLIQAIAAQLCRRIRKGSDKMLRQAEMASAIYELMD